MLSPRLSRKPDRKIYSPSYRLLSSRMSGEQCYPIVYLSPNKKNQQCASKLSSYIQSNVQNTKLKQENEQLIRNVKQLEDIITNLKQKLRQNDCNLIELTNNLYQTGQQAISKRNISKSKLRMVSHTKHKSNLQDLAIVQSSQLKKLPVKSPFKNSKLLKQNQNILGNISNIMPDVDQLKEANKTIAELRLNLDTMKVNLKILQHKLQVKQQFIQKLKIRQCQKLTNKVQFEGFSSKQIELLSSVSSWFDVGGNRHLDTHSIKSNLPAFSKIELGSSVNSYQNCQQTK